MAGVTLPRPAKDSETGARHSPALEREGQTDVGDRRRYVRLHRISYSVPRSGYSTFLAS